MRIDKRKLEIVMARVGITTGELTRRSGVPSATVTRIINGVRDGRPATIGKIAKTLGVDPTEIITDN